MKYKITIIKYDKNEYYEAEMAKWKEGREGRYGYRDEPLRDEPSMIKATRSLEVFLTEEEFQRVKKSTLEVFE